MIMYATNAKASVPPARPSRPSVMFTPLRAATIANAAKSDVDDRVDRHVADERHRDAGDVVGLLDLPRGDERDDASARCSFWRARIPSPVRALR